MATYVTGFEEESMVRPRRSLPVLADAHPPASLDVPESSTRPRDAKIGRTPALM